MLSCSIIHLHVKLSMSAVGNLTLAHKRFSTLIFLPALNSKYYLPSR